MLKYLVAFLLLLSLTFALSCSLFSSPDDPPADAGLPERDVRELDVSDENSDADILLSDAVTFRDAEALSDAEAFADVPSDDVATADAAHLPDVAPGPRGSDCSDVSNGFECAHTTVVININGQNRAVHYAQPLGPIPANGFPLVFAFQGSGINGELYFESRAFMAFGGRYQGEVVRALLDLGFAVVAPEAKGNGSLFWDTNQASGISDWESTDDHALMLELLARADDGRLGDVDTERLFAMGISSGGYMTSRMALSYPGRFEKLAIVSASYATCGGAFCVLPDALPSDHPPTVFFHGRADTIVPIITARPYFERLQQDGVETEFFDESFAGHRWLESSVTELPAFFLRE